MMTVIYIPRLIGLCILLTAYCTTSAKHHQESPQASVEESMSLEETVLLNAFKHSLRQALKEDHSDKNRKFASNENEDNPISDDNQTPQTKDDNKDPFLHIMATVDSYIPDIIKKCGSHFSPVSLFQIFMKGDEEGTSIKNNEDWLKHFLTTANLPLTPESKDNPIAVHCSQLVEGVLTAGLQPSNPFDGEALLTHLSKNLEISPSLWDQALSNRVNTCSAYKKPHLIYLYATGTLTSSDEADFEALKSDLKTKHKIVLISFNKNAKIIPPKESLFPSEVLLSPEEESNPEAKMCASFATGVYTGNIIFRFSHTVTSIGMRSKKIFENTFEKLFNWLDSFNKQYIDPLLTPPPPQQVPHPEKPEEPTRTI